MQQVSIHPHLTVMRWGATAVFLLTLLLLWQHEQQLSANITTPTFSPPQGHYQQDLAVTIHSSQPIFFTTDSSTPTLENGQPYERPIPIHTTTAVTILTARPLLADGTLGDISRATYFSLESSLPVLSVVTEPANLWDETTGLYTNPNAKGRAWERPAEATYLEAAQADGSRAIGFHAPAGMRIHGNSSRLFDKKSIRLYFRGEYGLSRLDYPLLTPLAGQLANGRYQSFVVHDGGQDFDRPGWTLLRTHLVSDLAADINGYAAQTQPILYFLNGELQGIYNIRHHFSPDFFQDVYGIDLENEVAQAARWDTLWHFMAENDLADPTNYAYVQSQIDIANFIDYNILQFYIANTDWVFTNADIFRADTPGGRWQWAVWDVDWSFGLVMWGGYGFDTVQWFYTNDREGMDRGATPLRRLLENPEFRGQFLARTADLLNTHFTSSRMATRLDALTAELSPDIAYEIGRWQGSSDWDGSVAYMYDFVRYRPDHLRQHLVERFDLAGTAVFHIAAATEGQGRVAINGTLVPPNWEGVYFQGTTVTVTAVPAPGFQFLGWQEDNLPPNGNLSHTVAGDQTFTPRFAPADLTAWQPGDVQIANIDHNNRTVELLITRPGLDLRGWQLTDNDHKNSTNEGTFTFPHTSALANLSAGTRVMLSMNSNQLAVNGNPITDHRLPLSNYRFHMAPTDHLALLTPDLRGIDFVTWGQRPFVTPYSFGILQDGVTAVIPDLAP